MWSISKALVLLAFSGWLACPCVAAESCPVRERQPLRFVDVFDGPTEDLAMLVPDRATKKSGHWLLDYVYDAGRFVVIRCKYADKQFVDVKLVNRVHRCDYKLDGKKTLQVDCR